MRKSSSPDDTDVFSHSDYEPSCSSDGDDSDDSEYKENRNRNGKRQGGKQPSKTKASGAKVSKTSSTNSIAEGASLKSKHPDDLNMDELDEILQEQSDEDAKQSSSSPPPVKKRTKKRAKKRSKNHSKNRSVTVANSGASSAVPPFFSSNWATALLATEPPKQAHFMDEQIEITPFNPNRGVSMIRGAFTFPICYHGTPMNHLGYYQDPIKCHVGKKCMGLYLQKITNKYPDDTIWLMAQDESRLVQDFVGVPRTAICSSERSLNKSANMGLGELSIKMLDAPPPKQAQLMDEQIEITPFNPNRGVWMNHDKFRFDLFYHGHKLSHLGCYQDPIKCHVGKKCMGLYLQKIANKYPDDTIWLMTQDESRLVQDFVGVPRSEIRGDRSIHSQNRNGILYWDGRFELVSDDGIRRSYTIVYRDDDDGEAKCNKMYDALMPLVAYLNDPLVSDKITFEKKCERLDEKKKQLQKSFGWAPVRPTTAYVFYIRESRPLAMTEFPNLKPAELIRVMNERWKTLPADEKQRFHDMTSDDKRRYESEMQEWQNRRQEN